MTVLLIASYDSSGKTALCAGLGKKWTNDGKKIGYIKPIDLTNSMENVSDAVFMNGILELGGDISRMSPLKMSQEELWRNLSEDAESFANKMKTVCAQVATGKDVLIIESPGTLKKDQVSTLALYTIAEKVNAKVLLLVSCSAEYKDPEIIQVVQKLGERLIGIIVNRVPGSELEKIKSEYIEFFNTKGIAVLGTLPELRTLLGSTVSEIARMLDGNIISNKDKGDGLVENVMLGVMTPDSAEDYFRRKTNKAVIARAERPDMLLAALETSTKCLIITKQRPSAPVMVKAEDKGVPIIVVNKDINEIISGVEQALEQARFHQSKKLSELVNNIDRMIDFESINSALSL
jgi:uncharacterized protein